MNRVVTALLGAAASLGALPPFPVRNDRHRPESPETQARIQIAAVAKRARKAKAFVRAAELTALGREHARLRVEILRHLGYVRYPFTAEQFGDAKARYERAWEAFRARRAEQ